jgi:tyrosyl-tRNA synthetase
MNQNPKINEQIELIKKNTSEVISEPELSSKIESSLTHKKPLKIKVGFDPTASDIHLGHLVLLKKLRTFQDLGHTVYFLVGDFTALIGDPSGRTQERPLLSREEILSNAETYTDQAFKILDKDKTRVVFNSEWFNKMSFTDVLSLFKSYTVARLVERDDFEKRMAQGNPITILEFIYPLLQGYDSVKIESDIEIGGTDQKFNLIIGRRIQEFFGQAPQSVITLPLLLGTDGVNKMSKSLNNYIGIQEPPTNIFGKTMSVSDEVMYHYYEMLTDFNLQQIKQEHPKEAKLKLAAIFVEWFYGKEEALIEREKFVSMFSEKKIERDALESYKVTGSKPLVEIISEAGLVKSGNQIRRLIRQGAIEFAGSKVEDDKFQIDKSGILKVGKKRFIYIDIS